MFERFICRQAILKDNLTLLGYDIRTRAESFAGQPGHESPAAHLIDAATGVFRWESLIARGLAFISFDERELLSGAALLLPKNSTVIEIATAASCSAELAGACEQLKTAGYRLALRTSATGEEMHALAELSDYLRVDVEAVNEADLTRTSSQAARLRCELIADHVDSWEAHRRARQQGIRYFQGDFFLKPQLFRRREIGGTRLNAMRLLQAILREPLDLGAIESIVRDEPALTYKLLRYLNSPAMERTVEIRSIRNAIALLGEQEFRRWAAVAAMVTPSADKPSELLRTGLTRAYFCEQLALRRGSLHPYDYFFTGLFSVMDAVLDQPLPEIVAELAIAGSVRAALLGGSGELRSALDSAIAYERGKWPELQASLDIFALPQSCGPEVFEAANRAAAQVLH